MIYKLKKNGDLYEVAGECEFKHPETREWVIAVVYKPVDGETVYVREKEEFSDKFEFVIPI